MNTLNSSLTNSHKGCIVTVIGNIVVFLSLLILFSIVAKSNNPAYVKTVTQPPPKPPPLPSVWLVDPSRFINAWGTGEVSLGAINGVLFTNIPVMNCNWTPMIISGRIDYAIFKGGEIVFVCSDLKQYNEGEALGLHYTHHKTGNYIIEHYNGFSIISPEIEEERHTAYDGHDFNTEFAGYFCDHFSLELMSNSYYGYQFVGQFR